MNSISIAAYPNRDIFVERFQARMKELKENHHLNGNIATVRILSGFMKAELIIHIDDAEVTSQIQNAFESLVNYFEDKKLGE